MFFWRMSLQVKKEDYFEKLEQYKTDLYQNERLDKLVTVGMLLLEKAGIEKNFELACFASLDKNIIQPLSDQWKFIEVEKIGRTRYVKITESGNNVVEFLI